MALEYKLPYSAAEIDSKLGNVDINTENINALSQDLDTEIIERNAAIAEHNTSATAHGDIRDIISELSTKVTTLLDSDDVTLDQMSEVVAYIKDNKELIDSITTSKVNISDIVDNLTTNVSNKPLSAAQGMALKTLIDELQTLVNTKTTVSFTQLLTSGTQVGAININGTETKIYAPVKPIITVGDSQLNITT